MCEHCVRVNCQIANRRNQIILLVHIFYFYLLASEVALLRQLVLFVVNGMIKLGSY